MWLHVLTALPVQVTKKPVGKNAKPMVVAMILQNIWQVYDLAMDEK